MSSDQHSTFGERLRRQRERAGKTRAVLGGLVGRSEEWVKHVENGRLLTPRLPMLLRLAEVLGVSDLGDLTGDQSVPVASVTKAAHPATPAVAAAMLAPSRRSTMDPSTLDVRNRVNRGWQVYRSSRTQRSDVGAILPGLITDARSAVRTLDGQERRAAYVDLARVYHLAQMFLAYQPAAELVWLAAGQGMAAAEGADNPLGIAAAAHYSAYVYRSANQLDAAEAIAAETAAQLDPTAGGEHLALWGQLHLGMAEDHAKVGRTGKAWKAFDDAGSAARAFDAGYIHPWLPFGGGGYLDRYAVKMEVELCRPGEAIGRSDAIDLDAMAFPIYKGPLLLDTARAYYQRREYSTVVLVLEQLVRVSAEYAASRPFARQALVELSGQKGVVGRGARELAAKVGIL